MMTFRQRFFAGPLTLVVLLVPLLTTTAFAQTRALAVDDLAREAELVAVGRVSDMVSTWSGDRTHIVTRVTLSVEEYVKGKGTTTVEITTLGGEVGEVGELYTHVPTFRQNESVVVFLDKSSDGSYHVAGGTQGKYTIEPDPNTGVPVVAGRDRLQEFTSRIKAAAVR